MTRWEISPFGPRHVRSSFGCGNPVLNAWLTERAGQWQRRELTRCYALVPEAQHEIFGYYAISSHHVSYRALPADQARGLPAIDVPVVLLGRLAVDRRVQGHGFGGVLLIDALRRSEQLAARLGIRAVEVDAIDETARGFYLHFGFTPLRDDRNHLFLPMHVVRKLTLSPDAKGG